MRFQPSSCRSFAYASKRAISLSTSNGFAFASASLREMEAKSVGEMVRLPFENAEEPANGEEKRSRKEKWRHCRRMGDGEVG
jgi:hypothetical protein